MIVINSKKLIILLLAYLMAYDLSVNDGAHSELSLGFRRVYGYFANLYLTSVPFLSVPAHLFVERCQVTSVHCGCSLHIRCHPLLLYLLFIQESVLLQLVLLFYFLTYFRMQTDCDTAVAVQRFHAYLVGKVRTDDVVYQADAFFCRMLFYRVGG